MARTQAAYSGWDFANIWYQAEDMRPILRAEATTTIDGITTISNLHQLQLLNIVTSGGNVTGTYVLSADIDASATAGSNASGIWGSSGFVVIGDGATKNFGGTDGFAGLFGTVTSGGVTCHRRRDGNGDRHRDGLCRRACRS